MGNVVLVIHLILAICLIGIVLLQRSEGGGLGLGGGGGGVLSSRGVATALGKLTWVFAVAFIGTSITLTIISAQNSATSSVVDRLGVRPAAVETAPAVPTGEDILAPAASDEPSTQPRAE